VPSRQVHAVRNTGVLYRRTGSLHQHLTDRDGVAQRSSITGRTCSVGPLGLDHQTDRADPDVLDCPGSLELAGIEDGAPAPARATRSPAGPLNCAANGEPLVSACPRFADPAENEGSLPPALSQRSNQGCCKLVSPPRSGSLSSRLRARRDPHTPAEATPGRRQGWRARTGYAPSADDLFPDVGWPDPSRRCPRGVAARPVHRLSVISARSAARESASLAQRPAP
jgi:hypothetical protein